VTFNALTISIKVRGKSLTSNSIIARLDVSTHRFLFTIERKLWTFYFIK